MTLAPLLNEPLHVQIHIASALVVAMLTPLQFWGFRKGSAPHRTTGYVWLSAMLVLAVSSFWITSHFKPSLMGYGLIHILSVFALFSIVKIIQHARAHRIRAHQFYVIGLAISFYVAGALALVPPRVLGRVLGLG